MARVWHSRRLVYVVSRYCHAGQHRYYQKREGKHPDLRLLSYPPPFHLLQNPVRLHGDENGWITGAELIKMELGEPDSSGRRRPVPVEGSEFIEETDALIVAIGNSPNPIIAQTTPGLEIGRKDNIEADEETGKTSRAKIWAGGDVVTGAATVILAMGAGRKAARSMHEYLMNNGQ